MNTVQIRYPGEFFTIFPMESQLSYENDLERIFHEWNGGSGMESELFKNSRIRSLSVNDFVSINGKWWQVDSIGWRPVTQAFVDKVEEAVRNHEKFAIGPWYALHEVMRAFDLGIRADFRDEPVCV